jgi:hypothetical protein
MACPLLVFVVHRGVAAMWRETIPPLTCAACRTLDLTA